MRLDRGKEPTDHHTLFVATGLEPKTYEAIVPPGRTIAPWASAPAVEGARSPNPKKPHALTLIPDHPKGEGQPGAIVNRRNSELILEQPAEMRRTAEAV